MLNLLVRVQIGREYALTKFTSSEDLLEFVFSILLPWIRLVYCCYVRVPSPKDIFYNLWGCSSIPDKYFMLSFPIRPKSSVFKNPEAMSSEIRLYYLFSTLRHEAQGKYH